MPAGQTTGVRRYFGYVSDSGETYSLLLDETLGIIGGMDLDDSNPPPPRRFRPRGVYVEGQVGSQTARKFITCSPTVLLYRTDQSTTVAIDGVNFSSTGRRGERQTFGANPPAPTP